MRRVRRTLTGLIACVALVWAGAAIAEKPVDRPGGAAGALLDALETCQDSLGASFDLGTCSNALATCSSDLGTCAGDLGTCNGELSTCQEDLAACEAGAGGGQLPGDGIQGTPLAYEDCGDGTLADLKTGLMWEKKVPGGDITTCLTALHGVDSQCNWHNATGDWIEAVNTENYADYSDWRIPHVKELQSIVDYSMLNPALQPVFGPTPDPLEGGGAYWSATPDLFSPDYAWWVSFLNGVVERNYFKSASLNVRAVRNGSCP